MLGCMKSNAPAMIRNALIGAVLLCGFEHGLQAAPVTEEAATHAGVRFRVVRSAPERVDLVWRDAKGRAYRSFDKVQTALAAQGRTPRFLMNAGLFQPGGTPCGLHIERGTTLYPLNLNDGYGNFHLKPNGVCWIEAGGNRRKAAIAPSETYLARSAAIPAGGAVRIETAVQSGPLLLDSGRRHAAFREGSANKLHRNGVGVDDQGRLVFAMTDRGQSVNFWDFAGLFLSLGCRDALFLDGDLSQMLVNPPKPVESNLFGAVFVICD
jgi:uncharacterized protein YigE (DUF2233 family)